MYDLKDKNGLWLRQFSNNGVKTYTRSGKLCQFLLTYYDHWPIVPNKIIYK